MKHSIHKSCGFLLLSQECFIPRRTNEKYFNAWIHWKWNGARKQLVEEVLSVQRRRWREEFLLFSEMFDDFSWRFHEMFDDELNLSRVAKLNWTLKHTLGYLPIVTMETSFMSFPINLVPMTSKSLQILKELYTICQCSSFKYFPKHLWNTVVNLFT